MMNDKANDDEEWRCEELETTLWRLETTQEDAA